MCFAHASPNQHHPPPPPAPLPPTPFQIKKRGGGGGQRKRKKERVLSSKDKWRGLLTHFSLLAWQVEYACDQDYELTGDTERTCEADGAWSGEDPVCTAITCEPPPNIDNGRYSYKDLKVWERERERESERERGGRGG